MAKTSRARVLGRSRHVGRGAVDHARSGAPRSIALAVDVGQLRRRRLGDDPPAGAAPPARSRRGRRRARASSPTTTAVPALQANALYEGKYPLVSALSRPVIVKHLVAAAREHGADAVAHGCTGKGNDQVRFEVSIARARARPRRARAGARVGLHPRGLHRLRRASTTSRSRRRKDKPVLDRREPVGPRDRVRRARGPVGRRRPTSRTRSRATPADAPREPRELVVGFERGVPVSLDGDGDAARTSSSSELGALVGAYGWGRLDMVENRRVGIKSREIYECPGVARADPRARRPRVDHARARPRCARSSGSRPRYAELVYDGLWFSPLTRGARRVRRRHAAARDRRGAPAARAGSLLRGRPAAPTAASTTTTSPPTTPPTRSATRTPPGFVRLWGLSARDVVAPPGPGLRCREPSGPDAAERPAALARPVRRRPGRRAARVHREPAVRPAARARRPRGLARARRACSARVGLLDRRRGAPPIARRARHASRRELADGHVRVRADRRGHPHRDRAAGHRARGRRRRQAAHRSQPQRPGRDSTCASRCGARARDRRARIARAPASAAATRAEAAGPTTYLPGLHAPAARAAGAARAPPARALLGARPRRRPLARLRSRAPTCRRSARARSPARACRSIPTRVAAELGFARRFENSLDAVSDRDFVAEALFVAALDAGAPVAPRRGDRAVVDRGVRLPAPRRRVRDRLVDAAAEEEPRHRRARARQGRPPHRRPHRVPRDAQGPAARVQPRPAGGQGAAVRRARHARAGARRADAACSRPPSSSPSAMRAAADAPTSAATDLAEHLVRAGHAVPRGARASSARWCARPSSGACRSTSW